MTKLPVLLAVFWLAGVLLLLCLPRFPGAPKGCWVHDLSGHPCPGCGGSRAGLSLLKGDPVAAFFFNPLVTAALLAGMIVAVLRITAGRQVVLRLSRQGWRVLALLLVLLVVANWLYLLSVESY